MKVKKLNLVSYGKFENREIEFSDGLNIVCGKNEAGKSTVLSFIRAMLYGYSGRGSVSSNDRKHYLPWGKTTLSGNADILLDSGKCINVSRVSGKSQGFDKIECFDVSNGDAYNFSGEEEIGCSEEAFLKTLCIKQLQSSISGEDGEISKKLINLTHSASEDIDTSESIAVISEYMKKFKALRGEKGIIYDLQNEISDLSMKISEAEKQRITTFEYVKKKNELEDKVRQCKDKLTFIKKNLEAAKNMELFKRLNLLESQKLVDEKSIEALQNEYQKISETVSELSVYEENPPEHIFMPLTETESLEKNVCETKKKIKKSFIAFIVSVAISLFSVAAAIFIKPFFIPAALCGIFSVYCLLRRRNLNEQLSENEAQYAEILLKNEKISSALSHFNVSSMREFSEKKAIYTSAVTELENIRKQLDLITKRTNERDTEISSLYEKTSSASRPEITYSVSELQEEEFALNRILEDSISQSSHIDGFLSAASSSDETPELLITKRASLRAELDAATQEYEASLLALETLNSVFSEMRSDFTPLVNEKASEYLKRLTSGSLGKIYLDKKFSVTAEKDGMKDLSYFSLGTVDQTYFAIRLAISDLLFGENKPLFIDDAFLQYDPQREAEAFKFLADKAAGGQQIIFFTCRPVPEFDGEKNIINL